MALSEENARVAFRAPPFWKANVELWFLQLESHFVTAGITADTTKFHCVVAAIDTEVLSYVSDIIRNPPAENRYSALKTRLIKQFSESESTRLRTLLQDLQLGDKRPSQLLLEMQRLAADNLSDDALRTLWMQRLPLNVQQILSVSSDKLSGLAKIADKIHDVSGLVPTISAVQHDARFTALEKQISKLSESIERLSRTPSRFRRSMSPNRRKLSPSPINHQKLCWYHHRFGKNARKCTSPCDFQDQGN